MVLNMSMDMIVNEERSLEMAGNGTVTTYKVGIQEGYLTDFTFSKTHTYIFRAL